ncbi:MAG: polyphosphate kinase 1 [Succinivibrio dextrinosolvens]|uniref:polyphosphate kinase 1 n=1 Tax=Succinivibrio sp. TaxID=2053619 RepID=UPI0025D8A00A|nr:polyphosphate kinase 1 [Succinivibrio sp.]MBQ9219902.1 polyphosphate kinase 1 [Succinivibrio sp.]MDY6466278.1 polyphosphate kinase 1 [Succinivibrio dextrinosolvens]
MIDKFVPKELSWLSFNGRVLQEAADPSVPLIERVRFLGIYSSNLDEFFKVRVAELKRQVIINNAQGENEAAVNLLRQVQNEANKYQRTLNSIYSDLLEELSKHNILMRDQDSITQDQKDWVSSYFKHHVLKHINPVIIDAETDLVSFLKDEFTYLLVKLSNSTSEYHALIEIPTDKIPRFIRMPSEDNSVVFMFLDDVIRVGMEMIFRGLYEYDNIEAYSIKMNRDAEYDLLGNIDRSVLENMSEALKQRLNAMPVRFSYDAAMPEDMVRFMAGELKMSAIDSMMPGNRYHNFKDFLSFPSIGSDDMENPSLSEVKSIQFETAITPFEAIAKKDVLLYYPYYSFDYFTEFLRYASYDPKVSSIKINIYRVASNSRVINSLMHAANNGKSVTVVVELKARFDEANNVKWASFLTQAGVKVLFGLPTLKIHSKLCLVTRHEGDKIIHYAHIGTGNFNEKTAKIYTDFALFTANEKVTSEVNDVFRFIEYPYTRPVFNNLLVSPLNAREKIASMIDREIKFAKEGKEAAINFKVNALVDIDLIEKLYEASQAGVKIRGIVRGMCSIKAGVPGLSENIYITSIVDRFLEHPRVMLFNNGGNEELYISSADWMRRNLDLRIEVGTKILDPDLKERIKAILILQQKDNRKARIVDADQVNNYVQAGPNEKQIRSQIEIHDYLVRVENEMAIDI